MVIRSGVEVANGIAQLVQWSSDCKLVSLGYRWLILGTHLQHSDRLRARRLVYWSYKIKKSYRRMRMGVDKRLGQCSPSGDRLGTRLGETVNSGLNER